MVCLKYSVVHLLIAKGGHILMISKLIKDLGFQADNKFSPSAQCTEAADMARRLIFMVGAPPKISQNRFSSLSTKPKCFRT